MFRLSQAERTNWLFTILRRPTNRQETELVLLMGLRTDARIDCGPRPRQLRGGMSGTISRLHLTLLSQC